MALIIGIGILLIIVLIVTVYRSKQANNISGTNSSWREDNADGSFSIYDKQGVSMLALALSLGYFDRSSVTR